MPLPKDPKSGITIGKIAAIAGLIAGVITSGGTILTCSDEWSAIRHAPAQVIALEIKADSLKAAVESVREAHDDHLDANKSAWEMHTGFPINRSHPTLSEGQ